LARLDRRGTLRHDAPVSSERASLRRWLGLAAVYAASFAVLGIYMQFLPLWLRDERGLDKAQISIVLAATTLARTLTGPFWSLQVDRSGQPRRVLRWLSLASVLAFAGYFGADSLVGLWCVAFAFGAVYSPMHPILDGLSVQVAQADGFAYGRLRVVGSLSFLLVILGVGYWLDQVGTSVVAAALLLALLGTALASMGLPPVRSPQATGTSPLWLLLQNRSFLGLLLASSAIQGSHAAYYNLSTAHWTEHGISASMAAVLWGEGVLAEIVLFFYARRLVDRLRPTTLLLLGGAGAVLRWAVLGSTVSIPWLLLTNWLHALSFSCTFLGSLRALERRVPPEQRATAQGLLGAANSGVGMVLGGLAGGFAYERFGGRAFFVMAAFALAGTAVAVWLRRHADHSAAPRLHSSTTPSPE
jgi:PPP family 3-phenylpropionic acid transporter